MIKIPDNNSQQAFFDLRALGVAKVKIKNRYNLIHRNIFLKFSIFFYIIEFKSKHMLGMSTTFWALYSSAQTPILFISLRMRIKMKRPITQTGITAFSKN